MGYAVLYLSKASGSDSAMSAHIERKINPKNVNSLLTPLNQELIEFPEEVDNRTEAIQHRLETAGLTRKIGSNQVRAIRVLLTGSNEDMKRIDSLGNLDDWCRDNVEWLQQTFGKENVVSAVLHMDETTPHIHATVVPIVCGERRKAKQSKQKYRIKNNSPRLCADDVMSRPRLKSYQNSYAAKMNRYGLQRGIDGSEAKHITCSQFYREVFAQQDVITEKVENLKSEQTFLADKIESLNREVYHAEQKVIQLKAAKTNIRQGIDQIKDEINARIAYKNDVIMGLAAELEQIGRWLPDAIRLGRVGEYLKQMGLPDMKVRKLLCNKRANYTGRLYSQFSQTYVDAVNIDITLVRNQTTKAYEVLIDKQPASHWLQAITQTQQQSQLQCQSQRQPSTKSTNQTIIKIKF